MPVTIEWDGNFADATIPIQDLIDELFGGQQGFNARIVRLLPLFGGESGSAVLRAIVKAPHSPISYVLKCGEATAIAKERNAHIRWSGRTALWQGAPPQTTVDPVIERNGDQWSAILYQLAGNTGAAEDLISLEEAVARFVSSPLGRDRQQSWASTFSALARILSSAYSTDTENIPAKRVLAIPSRELRAILSSVVAIAGASSAGVGSGWHEVLDAMNDWEHYISGLNRDVKASVCHGDLRGANVLLDGSTYHPFLIDFGGVGINTPIMDMARLEIDLLVRAGGLTDETIPIVHRMLFDAYLDDAWLESPVPILRVVYQLRKAFERALQQGMDANRAGDEVRFFHACRISTAAKMLRWADRSVTSEQARRHLLWMVLEGPRRVASTVSVVDPAHLSDTRTPDSGELRRMPLTPGPVLRQTFDTGIVAVHHSDDWNARNRAKVKLLESDQDLWLLAHSGWSYMAPEGTLFPSFSDRIRRQRAGGGARTQILMMSPFAEEGILRALQQAPRAQRFADLERTRTFTRFSRCLDDYRSLFHLAEGEDRALEVRVTPFSIGCSVLLAGSSMFYEPYHAGLASHRDVRLQAFPEFEFNEAGAKAYLASMLEQLNWYWDRSLSVEDYHAAEASLKEVGMRHATLIAGISDV
ncbi:phosphotransferase [Catellatospora sp. KI3]|uniref:phosphotransferase n=1 Tax=Catellatospora sp. KI3 TaxID=3041620 RepID=UPI0024827B07|nr:phosphotransferase [Catellatospora sp. KI3]MDI1461407.1 phosphotransferase [Catellatospora sp. KI3]